MNSQKILLFCQSREKFLNFNSWYMRLEGKNALGNIVGTSSMQMISRILEKFLGYVRYPLVQIPIVWDKFILCK